MRPAAHERQRLRVGELRPSQLLFSFGIGAIVDLPYFSAMVMGLDDWRPDDSEEISEPRLLQAARRVVGGQVQRLLLPPVAEDTGLIAGMQDRLEGVPVAPFPRWMVCPRCRTLAPLTAGGLFQVKEVAFRPQETAYRHVNCNVGHKAPEVFPARFLVACERGHLDDFPWDTFVHDGHPCGTTSLRLLELGTSGDAANLQVRCQCGKQRRMSDAFGEGFGSVCTGRRPQLRDYETTQCPAAPRTMLLGASNSWFPITLSALSIPTSEDALTAAVQREWGTLSLVDSQGELPVFRKTKKAQMQAFDTIPDEQLWAAIQAHKSSSTAAASPPADLKELEWETLSEPNPSWDDPDFRLVPVEAPQGFRRWISRVVLVERLREVRVLLGFTRLESPGDFGEVAEIPVERRGPIARRPPFWLPASEVRGEGLFLQFNETELERWARENVEAGREREMREAHEQWRTVRRLAPADKGFPGLRYAALHSLSHALMRQLALDSGYSAASIRERIYCFGEGEGAAAGILLYTAAPDSEGTLGGLVRLGRPERLGGHLAGALESMGLCASDPLCAEHRPDRDGPSLHGAACHACLFAPETSCERGNRYLDRTLIVDTVAESGRGLFSTRA